MKKVNLIIVLLLMLLAIIYGVNSSYNQLPNEPKQEENKILELEGIIKEIHLDYFKMEPGEFEKAYPNYFLMENEKKEEFEVYFTNELSLSVGMKVKITYDGVLLSIPPQIIPLTIKVLD